MKVTVIGIRKYPSILPGRLGQMDIGITFRTDDGMAYLAQVPEDEFDEAKVPEYVKAEMARFAGWTGKEIEV